MTFSITAFDHQTSRVGIAITTSSIAVGSRCPWVRSKVGAVATQNITDPRLGPMILDRIAAGDSATRAVEQIAKSQPNIEYRQLTAVDLSGNVGHFTGPHILGTHAVAVGAGCVAAGNLLANTGVPQAMIDAYHDRDASKHLAESLLHCLNAGLKVGGEEGSVHSGAVLVAHNHEWPEVDLRVDWDNDCPVARLLSIWEAYEPQRNDYLLRADSPGDAPSYGVPGDL